MKKSIKYPNLLVISYRFKNSDGCNQRKKNFKVDHFPCQVVAYVMSKMNHIEYRYIYTSTKKMTPSNIEKKLFKRI